MAGTGKQICGPLVMKQEFFGRRLMVEISPNLQRPQGSFAMRAAVVALSLTCPSKQPSSTSKNQRINGKQIH